MMKVLLGSFVAVLLALPGASWAGAVIQSMSGDVRVGSGKNVLFAARQDQRLASGTTIVTGPDAVAVLKFDDDAQMVLGQNTEFRIVDSQYVANSPQADRAVFDLVRGALRVVTGFIGRRNRDSWSLRAPQMTIGIRGTDFMVVLTNQAFVNVTQGAVSLSNSFGTSVLGAGSIAAVPSSAAAVTVVPASSLPPTVSSAFGSMGSAAGVTGGAASGAAAGTAGVASGAGVGLGTAAAIGAAAAAAAAAGGNGSSSTTTHH
jgi:hypothetical protein